MIQILKEMSFRENNIEEGKRKETRGKEKKKT